MISLLESNKDSLNYLFERQGFITTFSLSGNCWKGEAVSSVWTNIINIAKEQMVTVIAQNDFQHVSDADIQFLRAKTADRTFFSNEIDYYQFYLELREEYKQRPRATSP